MSGNRDGCDPHRKIECLLPSRTTTKSMPALAAALLIFLMRSARFMTISLGSLRHQVKHTRCPVDSVVGAVAPGHMRSAELHVVRRGPVRRLFCVLRWPRAG